MGSPHDPERFLDGGGLCSRSRGAWPDGCPSECPRRQDLGELQYPPCLCMPLRDALLLRNHGLLQTFLVVELFIPVPSGFSQPVAVSLPGSTPYFPAPNTPTHPPTGDTAQVGVHGTAIQIMHAILTLSCLPQSIAVFSFDPQKFLFCPSWFPHHEGVFLSAGMSSHL